MVLISDVNYIRRPEIKNNLVLETAKIIFKCENVYEYAFLVDSGKCP
jgi:hypothetical protein